MKIRIKHCFCTMRSSALLRCCAASPIALAFSPGCRGKKKRLPPNKTSSSARRQHDVSCHTSAPPHLTTDVKRFSLASSPASRWFPVLLYFSLASSRLVLQCEEIESIRNARDQSTPDLMCRMIILHIKCPSAARPSAAQKHANLTGFLFPAVTLT